MRSQWPLIRSKSIFVLETAGEWIQRNALAIALVVIVIWLGSVGYRLDQRNKATERAIERATKEVEQKKNELNDLLIQKQKLEEDYKKLEQSKAEEKLRVASVRSSVSTVNYAVNTGGVEQWRSLVAQYPWPVDSALTIMACESGGNASRHNYNPATGDNSWGLFQVNLWGSNAYSRPASSELVKPEVNISFAYRLWSGAKRFGHSGGWANCARKHGIY